MISRGGFVASLGASLLLAPNAASSQPSPLGTTREPWSRGWLEIHHISTGRGNSTLCIFPDGTSLLIDAGDAHSDPRFMSPARPDPSRPAGEWIGRYVERALRATGGSGLDYFLLTHFHPDHMDGVEDVARIVPIRTFIDRGFPKYDYLAPETDAGFKAYRRFTQAQGEKGARVERFRIGSIDQIRIRETAAYRATVRNLTANGEVWTGDGTRTQKYFPAPGSLRAGDQPDENMLSCAIKLSYGKFAYFAGGDLTCSTHYGSEPWRDIESPVAAVCGRVDVASVDHHGYFDASGPRFLRALRPRALIIPAWHVTHPDLATLDRLFDRHIYPGDRDVFSTTLPPESLAVNARFVPQMRSTSGHVVVRVAPGGSTYQIAVVSDTDESDTVRAVFGPYASRDDDRAA